VASQTQSTNQASQKRHRSHFTGRNDSYNVEAEMYLARSNAKNQWGDGRSHHPTLRASTSALSIIALLAVGATGASAKGGTAKPPTGPAVVGGTPQITVLPPAGPALPTAAPASNGFAITGFVQSATVNGGCGAGVTAGGTAMINGVVITIPTNMIVQFPANTLTWRDTVCPLQAGQPPLGLDGLDGSGGSPTLYPSIELSLDGNIVGGVHIAALAHFSQQSLNTGSGFVSFIDYTDGSMYISTQAGVGGGGGGATETRLLINDPNGRFGRAQAGPDARFSVDDANPTIKAAATGYPMCVPRAVDATGTPLAVIAGVPQDPRCPQKNRPKSNVAVTVAEGVVPAGPCRNFTTAGIVPARGDLTTTPNGSFCSAFVMKAIAGLPGTVGMAAANIATATDADPRQQVPFQVGDYITWSGTLARGGNGQVPRSTRPTTTGGIGSGDVTWVHTIDANVGVFTQPRTLPAYLAVGEFGIGVDPNPANAVAAAGVESTPRISLEAGTSDIASLVDVYLDDKGPGATPEKFRWVTIETMTGTLADQAAGKIPFITSGQPFGGGIQTQYTGPQPGRARIRAIKVPAINPALGACPLTGGSQACAVTQSPTRYLRVVLRSLCAPASNNPAGGAIINGNLDDNPLGTRKQYFDINGTRANLPGAGPGVGANASGVTPSDGTCLQSAQFANGLFTGQYMAPVGEYIFPENTLAGAPIIPANFWQMDFLVSGESGAPGESAGPQFPQPW
jgi:hypothetical protein